MEVLQLSENTHIYSIPIISIIKTATGIRELVNGTHNTFISKECHNKIKFKGGGGNSNF